MTTLSEGFQLAQQGLSQLGEALEKEGQRKTGRTVAGAISEKGDEYFKGGEMGKKMAVGMAATGDIRGAASLAETPTETKYSLDQFLGTGFKKGFKDKDAGWQSAMVEAMPWIKSLYGWKKSVTNLYTELNPSDVTIKSVPFNLPLNGVKPPPDPKTFSVSGAERLLGEKNYEEQLNKWYSTEVPKIQKNLENMGKSGGWPKESLDFTYQYLVDNGALVNGTYGYDFKSLLEKSPDIGIPVPYTTQPSIKGGTTYGKSWGPPAPNSFMNNAPKPTGKGFNTGAKGKILSTSQFFEEPKSEEEEE